MEYVSRRSPVLSQYGMASSSQPMVSAIGQQVLKYGGNAADACVAMNMALGVVEPMMTGVGGDCFALYYQASNKKVYGLNGSGRSPSTLTIDKIDDILIKSDNSSNVTLSPFHALNVTVPGNVSGTIDFHDKFGTLSREILFEPSIKLAENGFGVSEVNSFMWTLATDRLLGKGINIDSRQSTSYGKDLLVPIIDSNKHNVIDYRPPKMGEMFKNQHLANVLKHIAKDGKRAFYDTSHASGIARNMIDVIVSNGGIMTSDDLLYNHQSTFVEPICLNYKNKVNIYEIPPNGQGIAALMALNFYQNRKEKKRNNENNKNKDKKDKIKNVFSNSDINERIDELHHKIECMRLSFRYSRHITGDLYKAPITNNNKIADKSQSILKEYLSSQFGQKCFENEIFSNKINKNTLLNGGFPIDSSDTVSFVAVDKYGNACSFISSVYFPFGSALVPKNCGFALQNRGFNFERNKDLRNKSPNFVGPNKRPYHTIIPGMATYHDNNDLYAAFNVMGAWMQPQGHFQVVSNMVDHDMNPQEALDRSRFCINVPNGGALNPEQNESIVFIEPIIDGKKKTNETGQRDVTQEIVNGLKLKGHKVNVLTSLERQLFGRGQIIYNDRKNGILWAGSDGRADGCAIGLETDQEMTKVINKQMSKL